MLRFEADRSAVGIGNAFLPDVSSILVITRIDLQAGLRREYLQHDPRSGRYQSGGRLSDVTSRVQHPVVVVTDAVPDLYAIGTIERLPYRFGRREIERRALYRYRIADWNSERIDRSDLIGCDPQGMVGNLRRRITRKIEIGMVRQVDNGLLVRCSGITDIQCIVIG